MSRNAVDSRLERLMGEVEQAAGTVPPEQVPALLGRLEALKMRLWSCVLAEPAVTTAEPAARNEQLLTAAEVAARLAVPKAYVYELARRGELPTLRLGARYVRIPSTALETWVARHIDRRIGNQDNLEGLQPEHHRPRGLTNRRRAARDQPGRSALVE